MNYFNIDQILSRKIAGECSPKEENIFRGWQEEDPINRMIYERMMALKNAGVKRGKHINAKNSFDDIWEKSGKQLNNDSKKNLFTNYKFYLRLAASFALIYLIYLFPSNINKSKTGKIPEVEYFVKKNQRGQKSKILLTDGSYIWLNSESSIRCVKNFTDSIRLVELEGEAYFKVKKDNARKFVVVVGDTRVTALGTEFNVNSYEENKYPAVALTKGKVRVDYEKLFIHKSAILTPGLMTKYSEINKDFITRNFDYEDVSAWKDGHLSFKESDFHEVIKKLERWYGVSIQYNRLPSKSWQFTGIFKNEYLENVLNVLGFGEDFNYKIDDNVITLII